RDPGAALALLRGPVEPRDASTGLRLRRLGGRATPGGDARRGRLPALRHPRRQRSLDRARRGDPHLARRRGRPAADLLQRRVPPAGGGVVNQNLYLVDVPTVRISYQATSVR